MLPVSQDRALREVDLELVIQVFQQLKTDDHGRVMTRFYNEMVRRFSQNTHGKCNAGGIILSMLDALTLFPHRGQRDAVQKAIPAIINKIIRAADRTRGSMPSGQEETAQETTRNSEEVRPGRSLSWPRNTVH